ncbi:hypothetical protein BE17_15940 [Sorangium cellulosum]|uniref:Uncharacterized protein n=1 Tax=Sorangium cellulosum TaxID=56 RepID=A0A150QUY8_SORCE|nr:hypothetical protein BE17_15940 [Sorangium cellulosum]
MSDRVTPAPKLIWQNDHYTVLIDATLSIVWNVRSGRPFASLEELEAVKAALCHCLDGLGRSRYALLVDVRAAPGRNDPSFEAALERIRPRWLRGFRRVGVLVQSVVGALQIQRYARQDGIERLVTNDESALLRYLTEEG